MHAINTRPEIIANYKRATYCYAIPFSLFAFGFFIPFLMPLSLLASLPLGVAGIVFTKRGFKLSSNSGDKEKKDVGYGNYILGAITILLGLFGLAIAYVATS